MPSGLTAGIDPGLGSLKTILGTTRMESHSFCCNKTTLGTTTMGGRSTGLILTAFHRASFGTAIKLMNQLVGQQTTMDLLLVHPHDARVIIRALTFLRQFLVAHLLCIKPSKLSQVTRTPQDTGQSHEAFLSYSGPTRCLLVLKGAREHGGENQSHVEQTCPHSPPGQESAL